MIFKEIKIYLQNVCKNNFLINIILKTHFDFDIIFIQKLLWSVIQSILSSINYKEDILIGVPNHPSWTVFSRCSLQANNFPQVITYINIRLSSLWFSLWNNVLNHKDILCISFLNHSLSYFLINIYSDSSQLALKYLKNTEVNIGNILILTGDFNIWDSFWDLSFLHHSSHRDILFELADSFSIELSRPIEYFPTRYSNNAQDSDLVLDLIFLHSNSREIDNHCIHPE